MMKRLLFLFCATAVIHSCVLSESYGPYVNSGRLKGYADGLFYEKVIYPFRAVSHAVLLNEYQSATEEERLGEKFDGLRPDILHVSDDVICIRHVGEFYLTGDLSAPGTEWGFNEDEAVIRRTEDGWEFVLKGKDLGTLDASFSQSGNKWNAVVSGKTEVEDGLWSGFSTGDDPFVVLDSRRTTECGGAYDLSFEGCFLVDIMDGEEHLDYCYLKWGADGREEVVTSRR